VWEKARGGGGVLERDEIVQREFKRTVRPLTFLRGKFALLAVYQFACGGNNIN